MTPHPSFIDLEKAAKKERSRPAIQVSQSDNFIQGIQVSNSKKKPERERLRYEEDSDVKLTTRQPHNLVELCKEADSKKDSKKNYKKVPPINLSSNRMDEHLNSNRIDSNRNSTERTRRSVNAEEIIRNIKRDV